MNNSCSAISGYCAGDSACASNEECVSNSCVAVTCSSVCEEAKNHQCVAKSGCCTSDSDCGSGKECKNNSCSSISGYCSSNSDCGASEKCSGNTCVALSCGTCEEVSNHACVKKSGCCMSNSDCTGGKTCSNNQCTCPSGKPYLSGGQCVECTSSSHCAQGNECTSNACTPCTKGKVCRCPSGKNTDGTQEFADGKGGCYTPCRPNLCPAERPHCYTISPSEGRYGCMCVDGSCPSGKICSKSSGECVKSTPYDTNGTCETTSCPAERPYCYNTTTGHACHCTATSCPAGKTCRTSSGECV